MKSLSFGIVSVLALSTGCTSDKVADGLALMPDVATNYSTIVHTSYSDSVSTAQTLDEAIQTLVSSPSAANLSAAQDAWLASREPYLQTEVYRFYDGPIDNEVDGPEGLLNAWPMDESHVDYTMGMGLQMTGIVNDTSITIDAATLESKNEEGGEENVATGYHAIEFLLWGQDMSDDGPGNRQYTDYVDRGDVATWGCYDMQTHTVDCEAMDESECAAGAMWSENACAINSDRRGLYLTTASDMMVGHLSGLVDAWAEGSEYRTEFEGATSEDQLGRILSGMIVLSGFETGGERLQTALDSGDQEDEHSCFSDNTHRDMIQDVQGVQNVYLGTYESSVSGKGIKDVVAALDSELADRLEAEIQASLDAANALQTPFDQEIASSNLDGQARVQALISALRTQEATLEEVFRGFGLTPPVVE